MHWVAIALTQNFNSFAAVYVHSISVFRIFIAHSLSILWWPSLVRTLHWCAIVEYWTVWAAGLSYPRLARRAHKMSITADFGQFALFAMCECALRVFVVNGFVLWGLFNCISVQFDMRSYTSIPRSCRPMYYAEADLHCFAQKPFQLSINHPKSTQHTYYLSKRFIDIISSFISFISFCLRKTPANYSRIYSSGRLTECWRRDCD